MKTMKQFTAFFLSLVMILSLFAGLTFTASAAYDGTGTFSKCTGTLTSGYYVFGGTSGSNLQAVNNTVGTSWVKYTSITPSNDEISSPAAAIVWYYDADAGTFQNEVASNYIYWPTTGNSGGVGTKNTPCTVTETGTSGVYNINVTATPARYLRLNGTSGYRFYSSSTGTNTFSFYKLEAATPAVSYNITIEQPLAGGAITVNGESASAVVEAGETVTLTATPGTGYVFDAWSIYDENSNEITVTDNAFQMPAANITVTATFTAQIAATLTYSENGTTHVHSGTNYTGDSVSLTAPTETAPTGYVFVGWLDSTYDASDTEPTGILAVGDSYTLTEASNTLYAIYAIQGQDGSDSGTFKLSLVNGGTTYYVGARTGSNSYLDCPTDEAEAAEFGLEEATDSYYFLYYLDGETKTYVYNNASDTALVFSTTQPTAGDYAYWEVTETDGVITLLNVPGTRCLAFNSNRFSTYTPNGTQYPNELTKTEASPAASYTGYTSSPVAISSYTLEVDTPTNGTITATPADGSEIAEGGSASLFENASVTLVATPDSGYSFDGWVIYDADLSDITDSCVVDGTLTMPAQDVIVSGSFSAIPTHEVSFYGKDTDTTALTTLTVQQGSTIPSGSVPTVSAPTGYTFEGWVSTTYAGATAPTYFDLTSAVSALTTLYACYSATGVYTTNPVSYTITWSIDGATETTTVLPDEIPVHTDATKADVGTVYYEFGGWATTADGTPLGAIPAATADATYYAIFTAHTYATVNWDTDGNGSVDETTYCKDGVTPSHADPVKANDGTYAYAFTAWTPTLAAVTQGQTYTYTASFAQTAIVYAASLSLSKNTVKIGRPVTATATLTMDGVTTAVYTPAYSSSLQSVATIEQDGTITALTAGETVITATYTVNGTEYTATQMLTVVESTATGGYTLITQDNAPADWSGEYIIMGKIGGDVTYQNTWMLLTPNYDLDQNNTGVGIAINNEDAATLTLTDDGNGVGTGTIDDEGNTSSDVEKSITMEDTGLVTDTNGNDVAVYDTITSIDSAYAFTIECIDDVNQIYTIRVKDTSLYIACSASTAAGSNSLNFSVEATELAQWQFSVERVTKGGYNNDIIAAQNVGNSTRRLYFNSNQYGITSGQFRDYHSSAYGSLIGGNTTGAGQAYNLYLFGNPNPFSAQIYYQGEQITITNDALIPAGRTTPVNLSSALLPDINDYPNWEISTDAVWTLNSASSAEFTIDTATGALSIGSAVAGDYTLVEVAYVVHDTLNNVYHNISTLAKVTVTESIATYSTVIYETRTGSDTESQYTVYKTTTGTTTLPLAAYVENDMTGVNSKTGSVILGGTIVWTLSQTGSGATINASTGLVDYSGVTSDDIITVTATGATGDGVNATAATYKIYVKTISYTAQITHENGLTGTATIPFGTAAYSLGNLITDANDLHPGTTYSVSYTNAVWAIAAGAGASVVRNENGAATLNVSACEPGTEVSVHLAGMTATTIPAQGEQAITMTVPATTQVFTVGARPTASAAVNDTVVVDYALPVTFSVLANDTYENLTVTAMDLYGSPDSITLNEDLTITYTPSGELNSGFSFTYTVTLSDDSTASATVLVKPAQSVYYEETYGIFTFENGKRGVWTTEGAQSEQLQQTSSLLENPDIFEYDSNYSSFATYSGGSTRKATVYPTNQNTTETLDYPQVSFSFRGTGFDMISVTSNNTGAFMIIIENEGGQKTYKIVNTYYGYTYSAEAQERPEYIRYDRYSKTVTDGVATYTKWVSGSLEGFDYIKNQGSVERYYFVEQFYTSTGVADDNGFYVQNMINTHWAPTTADKALYQIPVISVDDLAYGTYNITVRAIYVSAFDIDKSTESYDFYFDAVRVHNPVNDAREFNYIGIRDRLLSESSLGTGSATPCPHETINDWTIKTPASNTTRGKGTMVRTCADCGSVMQTAYYYVTAAAAPAALDTGSGVSDPQTAALSYTFSCDSELDAYFADVSFVQSWRSSSALVITCSGTTATAQGSGTAYANLQLKNSDNTITYASAIHTNDITVTGSFIGSCSHTYVLTGTEAATCTTPGYQVFTCSKCGNVNRIAIDGQPALGHTYVYTDDANGMTHTVTCSREGCDYTAVENHNFVDGICTLCGAAQPVNTYSVTYVVPAGATAPEAASVVQGESMTTADAVAAPASFNLHSYTFLGWITATVTDTTTTQTFVAAGETYTPSANTAFYALYTYNVSEGGGESWTLVSDLSTVTEGTYALLTTDYHAFNGSIASGHGQITTDVFSFTDGVATSAPSGTTELTLTASGSGFTMYNANNGYLYAADNSSGNLAWSTTENSYWSGSDNWVYAANNARLRSYNNASFRTYSANNGDSLIMAKKGGSTTTYFTTALAAACTHENTTTTTVAATCTVAGSVTVICDDCNEVISVTPIAALGHVYESTTTAATCTTAGSTTYTCSVCGDSYTDTIPALGHAYSYTDNGDGTHNGVCANGCGVAITNQAHTYVLGVCSYCGALQPDNYVGHINPNTLTASVNSTPEIVLTLTNNGNEVDVADYSVSFSSTDTDIAEAFADGDVYNLFAYAIGEATITATFTLGGNTVATAAIDVTVVAATWTAHFDVPTGVTQPANQVGASATLPTPSGTPSDTSQTYNFVGWVAGTTYTDETEEPVYSMAGTTETLTSDVTYYALYSYDVTASGDTYMLTNDLTDGEYVIGALVGSAGTDNNIAAMNATVTSGWLKYLLMPPADGVITNTDSAYVWTLTNGATGFSLLNKSTNTYLTLGSGTGGDTASMGSSEATIYASTVNAGQNTFELHQSASATADAGNQLSCNLGNGYGYRMYAQRAHATSTSGISTQFRFFKASSGQAGAVTYFTTLTASVNPVAYTTSISGISSVSAGNSTTLMATLYADGVATTDYTSVAWESSNTDAVTINASGASCTASGVAAGTSTIRATFTVNGQSVVASKLINVSTGSSGEPTSAADVDYVIGNPANSSYSNVVANWGTRGTTASFETSYASSYYAGSYSYATLSALSGSSSSNASDIYSSALGSALHSMVSSKQSATTSYDATRYLFCYTDCQQSGTGTISSFYTGISVTGSWDSGSTWNREHTWPNSKGLNGSDENDIMMLRPTASEENFSRGNTAYGESSAYYNPNSESDGTYDLRGDVARIVLQHFIRWGNTTYLWGTAGVMESKAVLLEWMEADPVDTWEQGRNDSIESITGVRNVFVDYPEYAFLLLGASVPTGYATPTSATRSSTASGNSEAAVRSTGIATRDGETAFEGAVFLDGMHGSYTSMEEYIEDMRVNGPKNEVYLAGGQCIVFYLTGLDAAATTQDLQIGAKSVNSAYAAVLQVTAIGSGSSGYTSCINTNGNPGRTIQTATEMYYEFGGGVTWTNGTSCAIVIQNTGNAESVLSLTKLRYSGAEVLSFYVNKDAAVQANRMVQAMGSGENIYALSAPTAETSATGTEFELITPEAPVPEISLTVDPIHQQPVTSPEAGTDIDPKPDTEADLTPEQFDDVADEWYFEGVEWALSKGLMKGVGNGMFGTNQTSTRAMLVTILYRMANKPAVDRSGAPFDDVALGKWYSDAVIWAVSEGITSGTDGNTFSPNADVTREQMVAFLWRFAGCPESTQSLAAFADAAQVSTFARSAMSWAVENGIVRGDGAYLQPNSEATRAQIANILMRAEKHLQS